MAKKIDYQTGDNDGGLPEECDEKGIVHGVDTCLTCPDLCCLENKNNGYKNRVPLNTLKKLIERSKK